MCRQASLAVWACLAVPGALDLRYSSNTSPPLAIVWPLVFSRIQGIGRDSIPRKGPAHHPLGSALAGNLRARRFAVQVPGYSLQPAGFSERGGLGTGH